MQRVILVLLAVLISIPFFLKSRLSGVKSTHPAFSVLSSNRLVVQVSGAVRHPGIYEVSANTLTGSVIKMAGIEKWGDYSNKETMSGRLLKHGDRIHLEIKRDGTGIITTGAIPAAERMVLGIPLDINEMSEADFVRLEGVGAVMARRIVEYRQKNGGWIKVDDLLKVEGIGEIKYKKIRKYF